MDEVLLKRSTDCVYFLASPFTCKKGSECEYRHSEMARLNPRDCWYWLSGNCLNPTCGFRHPPMDMQTEASVQADVSPNNSSFPPSKNNVPCYFYLNAYCNKGDKCPFLHGSEDTSAGKLKVDTATNDAPTLVTKILSETSVPKKSVKPFDAEVRARVLNAEVPSRMHTEPLAAIMDRKARAIVEPVLDQPGKCPGMWDLAHHSGDKVLLQQKKRIQSSDAYSILEKKTLQDSLDSEYEEAAVSKSATLNPPENIVKSDQSIHSDQSLEEQVDQDGVQDEWWESSPGFDVLVEGRYEGMDSGNEQEYVHGHEDGYDGNADDHENNLIDQGYEDQHDFSDRFLHEDRVLEPSYYSDDDGRCDFIGYSHGYRRKNHIMSHKRKFLTLGLPNGGHYGVDLREHLSKRRFHGGCLERHAGRHAFRRRDFPLHSEERKGERQRIGSTQTLHRRLASKLVRNGVSLPMEESTFVPNQRGRSRKSQFTSNRCHHERKRPRFSPRVQRTPFTRRKRENEESISFAGPKTLSQIKEEKDRAREDGNWFNATRRSGQNSSVDFEGPKPLSEILKEKGGSLGGEDNINSNPGV